MITINKNRGRLDNKGFAISGVLYPVLILALFLIIQILFMMQSRKTVLDRNNKELIDTINTENKVYTNEELSNIVNDMKKNQALKAYPVGSYYTTSTSVDPAVAFGGTWKQISKAKDMIYVGSQTIYDKYTTSTKGKVILTTSYDETAIDGIFTGVTKPVDYSLGYRFSAHINTYSGNYAELYMNNKKLLSVFTWSVDPIFKKTVFSDVFYSLDSFLPHLPVINDTGLILEFNNTDNYPATISDITVHGYFVSNKVITKYERIS